jgi:YhcH/YjgK/YiaL family protein
MIFDTIHNASKYYSYSPRVKMALEYLEKNAEELISMPAGRVDIDGDNVYALVLDRPCDPNYNAYWEGHRLYLDIHYVADGEEWFGWSHISNMKETEYVEKVPGEHAKYEGEGVYFLMRKGDFCLTDLEDIHAPSTYRPNSPFLRKICVKVKL